MILYQYARFSCIFEVVPPHERDGKLSYSHAQFGLIRRTGFPARETRVVYNPSRPGLMRATFGKLDVFARARARAIPAGGEAYAAQSRWHRVPGRNKRLAGSGDLPTSL